MSREQRLEAALRVAILRFTEIAEPWEDDDPEHRNPPGYDYAIDYALAAADEARAVLGEQDTTPPEPSMDECSTCGEVDEFGRLLPQGECPRSQRSCGHHCNHIWTHDGCDWCGLEVGESGEPQVGAVVAYLLDDEPHLAWREPVARQDRAHRWHVFHGMAFGWRTWAEVQRGEGLRFLGLHDLAAAPQGEAEPPEHGPYCALRSRKEGDPLVCTCAPQGEGNTDPLGGWHGYEFEGDGDEH